jgi:hypothetical protein
LGRNPRERRSVRDKKQLEVRYEELRSAGRCNHATALERLVREERNALVERLIATLGVLRPKFTTDDVIKVVKRYIVK